MNRQSGAALLLLVPLLIAGAGMLLVAQSRGYQAPARAATDAAVLALAKQMIMGYALANPRRPGELPFPDRHTDGNADGNGDCVSSWDDVTDSHLLGQFPGYLEQGCGPDRAAFGLMPEDGGGHRLWYAVARSLTYPRDSLNSATNDGWLRVFGPTGVVAEQTAFIVFAPGAPVGDQQRTGLAQPAQYLDATALQGITHDNADGDEQFVIAPHHAGFNDRLLVVSRAAFMEAVTRHVAQRLSARLQSFRAAYGHFPYAATAAGTCVDGHVDGAYPLTVGDCVGVPGDPPAWFESQWLSITRYRRLAPDAASLAFEGCSTMFAVTPGAVAVSAESCA